MKKYKVCVYAICKNEESFVDRFMASAQEADIVVVLDTGSSDNTVQKLRDKGAIVHQIDATPFRFDHSRNKCLEFIPEDVDICVSADLDEVIQTGWREHLENAWQEDTTRGSYLFNWSFNEDSTPAVQYIFDRIHSRQGYRWIFPAHEVLDCLLPNGEKCIFMEGVVYNHYPDHAKDRSLYLPLLEIAVEENPDNPRNLHYLGREYMYVKDWDNCIKTLVKYLELPDSHWDEERAASMRFIARAYKGKNNYNEAKKWLYRSIAECPYIREGYVETAFLAYDEKDWYSVFYFANQSLRIKEKSLGYMNENFAWDFTPYDLAALGSYYIGMQDHAVKFSKKAIQLSPDNERLKNNHKFYTQISQL